MSFAQKEQRNLHSDLAICNAALVGPWEWGVDSGELLLQNSRGVPVVFISEPGITDADARFIAEARTGWPHAIERAMAAERKLAEAEAEVERLRLIFGNPLVYEALAHYTDEHIDSDARPDDWETVFDARVEAFKLAKEATADDH
jgi:hypothetical protein